MEAPAFERSSPDAALGYSVLHQSKISDWVRHLVLVNGQSSMSKAYEARYPPEAVSRGTPPAAVLLESSQFPSTVMPKLLL